MSWHRLGWAIALATAVFLCVPPAATYAQDESFATVDATPKGTIGLGLVGAELGLIIPSVAGLDKVWALTVFPAVGAAGGALAGYFALDEPGREKGSVAALVVGLAGVIPAVLLTVKAVRYSPEEDYKPPRGGGQLRAKRQQRALESARAGPGLLRRSENGFRAGVPGFSVGGLDRMDREAARLGGLRRGREVRLSLASGVF